MEREDRAKILHIPSPFFLVYIAMIVLLPFSMFLFDIDMWNANGLWFQGGVFILFLLSMFEKERNLHFPRNKPFCLLSLWILISTGMVFYASAKLNFFNTFNIFAFMNFLTFVLFYRVSVEHMSKGRIRKLFKCYTYIVFVVIVYCILQKMNLDQFQHPTVEPEGKIGNRDIMVGTIGNPTHLAAYLAIFLPILYSNESKTNFVFACLTWLIIGWTGSASGLLTAIVVTLFYGIFFKMKMMATLVIGIVLYAILFMSRGFDIHRILVTYANPEGRFVMWGRMIDIWKLNPLFGYGLGFLKAANASDKSLWDHAHNEFLHYALEIGIVGLSAIVYAIVDYYRIFRKIVKTELSVALGAMFTGFLVNSFFNFPTHLWMISTLGMMSYCFLYVIQTEEEYAYEGEVKYG